MGKTTSDEALNELRGRMVNSMRSGKLFVINLQGSRPDFKSTFTSAEDNFPSDKVFDFEQWKDEPTHMKILKDGENTNIMGDKGAFMLHRDFRLCILAKYMSDEDCNKLISLVPSGEKFLKFIVENA